ncbi:MAG: UDP-2,3-diacylglucosamine diphosphatase LpxI domain-containing protein, partial [Verrucomicrobiota bacterium]
QDMRFDFPVIGPRTIQSAAEGKVRVIVLEAGRTLVLEAEAVKRLAEKSKITVWGHRGGSAK